MRFFAHDIRFLRLHINAHIYVLLTHVYFDIERIIYGV